MKKLLSTSLLALALMAGSANAANVLTLTGGETTAFLDGSFDIGAETGLAGNEQIKVADAPGLGLLLDSLATVTFTYLGEEAGFNNFFRNLYLGNELLFTNNGSTEGDEETRVVAPNGGGFLQFMFVSNGSSPLGDVVNGNVTNSGGALGTIAFIMLSESLNEAIYLALFNDGGGPDADYDDMAIRIHAIRPGDAVVPLPAGLLLLLSGLAGLGFLGRARAKTA